MRLSQLLMPLTRCMVGFVGLPSLLSSPNLFAQACLPTNSGAVEFSENLFNTSSPFVVNGSNGPWLLYKDHNSAALYINQNPTEAGSLTYSIASYVSSGGLGDVTAATSGSNVLIAFYNSASSPYNQAEILQTSATVPANNSAGTFTQVSTLSSVGGESFNAFFTPSLSYYAGLYYMAFVSGTNVYLASSSNGVNWSRVSTSPVGPVTRSRPSLATWDGNLFIAYTTTSGNVVSGPLFLGNDFSTTYSPSLTNYSFQLGNSNSGGAYAGVALVGVNGDALFLEEQSTASSQVNYSTSSSSGTNFPAPVPCGNQLRWTPSGVESSAGLLLYVTQGDHNTQIYGYYETF